MRRSSLLAAFATFLLSAPAFAHHMTDGRLPATFSEGLLSGLAHPVIGPDHFLAIVAVGLLSGLVAGGGWLVLGFVVAGMAGTGIHLGRVNLPAVEPLVAASVVLLGLFVLSSKGKRASAGRMPILLSLVVLAGVVHGYAFGESIVGSHRVALGAYLLGLAGIQLVICLGAGKVAGLIARKPAATQGVFHRLTGGFIAVAGIALFVVAVRYDLAAGSPPPVAPLAATKAP